VSSFKSELEENYYHELLDAFNELHKEATKLQKSNSKRKGEIKWLEGRVKQLEEENENLITSLEKLEKSEKYSWSKCKQCLEQLEKIKYLMKTLSKFSMGRSNLDIVLGSQRSVLKKEGIDYNDKSSRLGPRNFLNISKPSSITCTYCYEPGHSSNSCYFKNSGVPKGEFKWVPKGTTKLSNMKGPKFTWVPASSKQSDLQVNVGTKQSTWYLDIGCSRHMIGDIKKFSKISHKVSGHVTYGDNNRGKILGTSKVRSSSVVEIEDVLLVDGLKHNLLSISQLCDKNLKVTFEVKHCLICHASTNELVFVGKSIQNIYMVDFEKTSIDSIACLFAKNDEPWIWHKRLAHIHMGHLNKLVSKHLVTGLPDIKFQQDKLCDACQKGKQVK